MQNYSYSVKMRSKRRFQSSVFKLALLASVALPFCLPSVAHAGHNTAPCQAEEGNLLTNCGFFADPTSGGYTDGTSATLTGGQPTGWRIGNDVAGGGTDFTYGVYIASIISGTTFTGAGRNATFVFTGQNDDHAVTLTQTVTTVKNATYKVSLRAWREVGSTGSIVVNFAGNPPLATLTGLTGLTNAYTKYEYETIVGLNSSDYQLVFNSNNGKLFVDDLGVHLSQLPVEDPTPEQEVEIKKELSAEYVVLRASILSKLSGAEFDAEEAALLLGFERDYQRTTIDLIRRELHSLSTTPNQNNVVTALLRTSLIEGSSRSLDFDTVLYALEGLPDASLPSALGQIAGASNANTAQTMTATSHAFGNAVSARLDQVRAGGTSVAELASRNMTSVRFNSVGGAAHGSAGMSSSSMSGAGFGESSAATAGISGGDVTGEASGKLSVWARGLGVFSNNSGDDTHSGFNRTTAGALAGADMLVIPDLRVGATLGYARSDVTGKNASGNATVDSYYAGIYAGWTPSQWFVDGNLGFALNKVETERDIAFGIINRTAKGKTTGYNVSLETKTGYRFSLSDYTLEPSVSLRYDLSYSDTYTETGAEALNLTVQGKKRHSVRSGVGGRAIRTFHLNDGLALEPELRVRWDHDILDPGTTTKQSILGQEFTVTSAKTGRDAAVFGAGVSAVIDKNLRLYTHYDSEIRTNQLDHIVTAGRGIG
ncbi:exported hypothetical protein [uncultured Gammaproteobacteria bacterium]